MGLLASLPGAAPAGVPPTCHVTGDGGVRAARVASGETSSARHAISPGLSDSSDDADRAVAPRGAGDSDGECDDRAAPRRGVPPGPGCVSVSVSGVAAGWTRHGVGRRSRGVGASLGESPQAGGGARAGVSRRSCGVAGGEDESAAPVPARSGVAVRAE